MGREIVLVGLRPLAHGAQLLLVGTSLPLDFTKAWIAVTHGQFAWANSKSLEQRKGDGSASGFDFSRITLTRVRVIPGGSSPSTIPGWTAPTIKLPSGFSQIRLMKSAAPRVGPRRYFTIMSDHRARRPTEASNLSASRYFKALWSVSRVKGFPSRRARWFLVAQTTARHSCSVAMYCY